MLAIQVNTINDLNELAERLVSLNEKYFNRSGSSSKYKDFAAELANFSNGFQQAKQHLSEESPYVSALSVDSHQYHNIFTVISDLINVLHLATEFRDACTEELLEKARSLSAEMRETFYSRVVKSKQILVLSIHERTEYTESLRSELFSNNDDLKFALKGEIEDKLTSCLLDSYKVYLDVAVPSETFQQPSVSIEDSLDDWFKELAEKNNAEDLVAYLNILPAADSTRDSWRYSLEAQNV